MNPPTREWQMPELPELKLCPFCGGSGETIFQENGRQWLGMRYSQPVSVSIRHWCEPVEGQPKRMIERVGRDRESAIAAWNARAAPKAPPMPEEVLLAVRQIENSHHVCWPEPMEVLIAWLRAQGLVSAKD